MAKVLILGISVGQGSSDSAATDGVVVVVVVVDEDVTGVAGVAAVDTGVGKVDTPLSLFP